MADFGAELREARERKGVSLRQIAAATKISVGALEALERNDISKLPGGIFSRAFVRSYATEVGLDPDDTIRKFLAQFPGEAADAPIGAAASLPRDAHARVAGDSIIHEGEEEEFESKQRMAGVVLRLVLISLPIAGAILYFTMRGNSTGATKEPPSDAPAKPQVSTSSSSEAPVRPGAAEPARPAAADIASPASAPSPASTASPAPALPIRAADRASAITIEIAPTADCWIHLMVDGDLALARVVRAGEHERREFTREAVLQVGDAAVCAFSLNGRTARPLGDAGKVREVRITPANYPTFLQ